MGNTWEDIFNFMVIFSTIVGFIINVSLVIRWINSKLKNYEIDWEVVIILGVSAIFSVGMIVYVTIENLPLNDNQWAIIKFVLFPSCIYFTLYELYVRFKGLNVISMIGECITPIFILLVYFYMLKPFPETNYECLNDVTLKSGVLVSVIWCIVPPLIIKFILTVISWFID